LEKERKMYIVYIVLYGLAFMKSLIRPKPQNPPFPWAIEVFGGGGGGGVRG